MRFANPYSGYVAPQSQPEEFKTNRPSWLMPFNIGLLGADFILGLLPGMQGIAIQFAIGEATSGIITGTGFATTGSAGTWWSNLLSFGGPFLGVGAQLISNFKFLRSVKTGDTSILKNKVSILESKYRLPIGSIDKSILPKNFRFKGEWKSTRRMRRKLSKIERSNPLTITRTKYDTFINTATPEDVFKDASTAFLEKNNILNLNRKNLFEGINNKQVEKVVNDMADNMKFFGIDPLSDWADNVFNTAFDSLKITSYRKIGLQSLEQLEDIADAFRRLGIGQDTSQLLISMLRTDVKLQIDRTAMLERFITTLDLEESMLSREFATLLKTIKNNFIKSNKMIDTQAVFYRAWQDAFLSSPTKFLSRYRYENPFLNIIESKQSGLRNFMFKVNRSKTINLIAKGGKLLNPSIMSRQATNIFFRRLTKIFNNYLKGIRRAITKEKSVTDKTLALMEKGMNNAEKLFIKGEEAVKRLKRGEIINLDSSWLESLELIEKGFEESMYVLNFQPDTTNGKLQVLIWCSDEEVIRLIEYTGSDYLDNYAYSRGGRAIRLGAILGWGLGIGEALPLGKIHLSSNTIRKLLSIASNLKKTFTGNYAKKWENPHKYLFENFYLYSISRGSKFVSRTIFGGLLKKAMGGYLGRKLNKELSQTILHATPMELQRMSTLFISQTARNALQGKKLINKKMFAINATKFVRDQSRFLANEYNPNMGTLITLRTNRKLALIGRATKIGGWNLNKRK